MGQAITADVGSDEAEWGQWRNAPTPLLEKTVLCIHRKAVVSLKAAKDVAGFAKREVILAKLAKEYQDANANRDDPEPLEAKRLVLDRTDLAGYLDFDNKRYAKFEPDKDGRNNFVLKGCLHRDGTIVETPTDREAKKEKAKAGSKLVNVSIPVRDPAEPRHGLELKGGGKVFTVKVYSVELPYLPPMIRRCEKKGIDDKTHPIFKPMQEVLRAGVDIVNVEIYHQMLEQTFDKTDLLQQMEDDDEGSRKDWAFTSYLWVVRRSFEFKPHSDKLQEFFDQFRNTKKGKDQIIRAMKAAGLTPKEITLFQEGTGGATPGPQTDRYLRLRAEEASVRGFEVFVVDPKTGEKTKLGDKPTTIDKCLQTAVQSVLADSTNVENWSLLVGREPFNLNTVQDCMHMAKKCKVAGDEPGHIRNVMKAVRMVVRGVNSMQGPEKGPKQKGGFGQAEIDAILSAHSAELERQVTSLLEEKIERDRFETQFQNDCMDMIKFIDQFLLFVYDEPEEDADDGGKAQAVDKNVKIRHQVLCLRTKADLLRYMYVWVPAQRVDIHKANQHYEQALKLTEELESPHELVVLTTTVNLGVFCAEVYRRMDSAAEWCRKGYENANRDLARGGRAASAKKMSPAAIYNFNLLRHNCSAFESQLVILGITFAATGFELHKDIEPRPGDSDYEEIKKERKRLERARANQDKEPQLDVCSFAHCAGIRWTGATATDNMITVRPAQQMEGEERAVHRWLKGTPLSELYTSADSKVAQEDTQSLVSEVRWVKHVERIDVPDALETESSSSSDDEEPDDDKRRRQVKRSRMQEVMIDLCKERDGEGTGEKVYAFKLACVARLLPQVIQDARERDINEKNIPWLKEIKEALMKGGGQLNRDHLHVVKIADADSLETLFEYVDSGGVVHKHYYQAGILTLLPGDCLQGSEQCPDIEQYIMQLKSFTGPFGPLEVTFVSCLQVRSVHFLARAPYSEVHQHFEGFREPCPFIYPYSDPKNPLTRKFELDVLAKEVQPPPAAAARQGGKVIPKRIRNLSARRNPTVAGRRGCQ